MCVTLSWVIFTHTHTHTPHTHPHTHTHTHTTIFKQHITRTGYDITNYVWPEEGKFRDEVNSFYKTWAGCYPSVTFSFPSHHKIFGDSAVCCPITVTDCTLPRCHMNLISLPFSPEGEITDLHLVWQIRHYYINRPQPWRGGQTVFPQKVGIYGNNWNCNRNRRW